jgi:excinuclease ABC subunit C
MTKKTDYIKEKINQIPELPGIYKMLDSKGNIIYVGKSKCLRKRVNSYFISSPTWEKVNRMVSLIKDIDYIVTDTHLEARLLECELIKTIKPCFNAQMKNDQNYVYLKVLNYNQYNPLSIVEGREEDCFGPFRRKFALNEFLTMLKNIYPIEKTKNGYEFDYHIFPIPMERETFEENRSLLLELFSNERCILDLTKTIQRKMEEAASTYRYETASIYRDMIHDFIYLKNRLNGYRDLTTRDILLKVPFPNGYKLFFVSNSHIINSEKYPMLSDKIIKEFLQQSKSVLSSFQPEDISEKANIDYRDILYSEINSMHEDMIQIIDA